MTGCQLFNEYDFFTFCYTNECVLNRNFFCWPSILAPSNWFILETEVSMDALRASPCGSPSNCFRSQMLQPTCKFLQWPRLEPRGGHSSWSSYTTRPKQLGYRNLNSVTEFILMRYNSYVHMLFCSKWLDFGEF